MKIGDYLGLLARGNVPAVSVLFGEEGWFADEAVRRSRASFLGEDEEGFQSLAGPVSLNDRDGTPFGAVLDECRTLPMFGGRRLVLYRIRKLDEGHGASLAELHRAAPPFARLIVHAAAVPAAEKKAMAAAKVPVVECKRLFATPWPGKPEWDTALNKWVVGRARERSLRLDLRTAHVLSTLVGNDLRELDAALDKLSVEEGPVTEERVREMIGGGRDYDGFAFGEAVYDGLLPQALRISRSLFHEGVVDQRGRLVRDAGFVASRLLWSVRYRLDQVYQAAVLLEAGRSKEEVTEALGGRRKPWALKAPEQAARFGAEGLRGHFVAVVTAEAALRTAVPEETVIESLLAELLGKGGSGDR